MGWIRKFLWISGGLILLITFMTMSSQVYWQDLGWEAINLNAYIFLYVFGGSLILSMFVYDFISYLMLRSNIHSLMDDTEQISPEEITRILDAPLWRVLPIFRKGYDPGILINIQGRYIHFNKTFQEKFLEEYSRGTSLGDLAHKFNLSKKEINLILDELYYRDALPEVETPIERPPEEIITKGLRKTVRHKRKLKKKS